ncbi:hypothetical protein GCM10009304_24420 [Pseudomonas matsuisoli]|uniref:Uncharacterized protein n=1 Tax=Pseudomonas matsuisoli TaxID=1515666 RepID=A0A917PWW9_9PSED|nr:hypothetical protein GCM10009304_24420 [Pseudomonas matsuisoli]
MIVGDDQRPRRRCTDNIRRNAQCFESPAANRQPTRGRAQGALRESHLMANLFRVDPYAREDMPRRGTIATLQPTQRECRGVAASNTDKERVQDKDAQQQ